MAKQGAQTAVPRLRFPEFLGAEGWTPTPLGKSGTFVRGLTYGAGDVQDDGLLVVRSTNIQDGRLVLDKDLVFVDRGCAPDQLLQAGDLAICMSNGSKSLVGKSAEFSGNYDGAVTVGAFCSIFRPSLAFAKLAFKSDSYAEFVALAIGGGNINNLKNSDLELFEFAIPVAAVEQQKIADCLISLDEVIAAQGRKVEALKVHKRGLMQQLFPREGETRPRLRFPEFSSNGGWKARRIADLLDRASNPADVDVNARYREIGVRSHGKGVFHKGEVSGKLIENKRVFWVVPNALVVNIVFAWERAVATTSDDEVGMIASHRFPMYLAKAGKCKVEFLKRAFLTPQGKQQLELASPGGAGRNRTLGQTEFEKIELLVPNEVKEQQRIADCLSSLDTKITTEFNQLAALKTHKQGLMQQLFPASGGN